MCEYSVFRIFLICTSSTLFSLATFKIAKRKLFGAILFYRNLLNLHNKEGSATALLFNVLIGRSLLNLKCARDVGNRLADYDSTFTIEDGINKDWETGFHNFRCPYGVFLSFLPHLTMNKDEGTKETGYLKK